MYLDELLCGALRPGITSLLTLLHAKEVPVVRKVSIKFQTYLLHTDMDSSAQHRLII